MMMRRAALLPTRVTKQLLLLRHCPMKRCSTQPTCHDDKSGALKAVDTGGAAVVRIVRPPTGIARVPLVIDSPHSGTSLPPWADPLVITAKRDRLTQSEDSFVDELWSGSPDSAGATLVSAVFPRWFIDPNRAADDIDPDLMDPGIPIPRGLQMAPGAKSKLGVGLIRR